MAWKTTMIITVQGALNWIEVWTSATVRVSEGYRVMHIPGKGTLWTN